MEIIFIGALIGVIIALDTTHLFQSMISQPIFACPIIGLIFGQPVIGLLAGLIFQVSFLKSIPVGAATFPENTLGSISATLYLLQLQSAGYTRWELFIPAAILLGLIVSFAGMHLTVFHRKSVNNRLQSIEQSVLADQVNSFTFIRQMIRSLVYYMVIMFLLVSISVSLFYLITIQVSDLFTAFFHHVNMYWWICAFLFIGFARLANQYVTFKRKKDGEI